MNRKPIVIITVMVLITMIVLVVIVTLIMLVVIEGAASAAVPACFMFNVCSNM